MYISELYLSVVLIDDIHDGTQLADMKVRTQTRRVEAVRRKDSCKCTCREFVDRKTTA